MIGKLLPSKKVDVSLAAKAAKVTKNLAHVASLVALYTSEASLGKLRVRDRNARLGFFTGNVAKYCRRVLKIMNIEVEVIGFDPHMMMERNFLLVCNHLSYLDIIATSSVQPAVFVTSVDMGQTPFLGQMAELGGSIFVERRHRGQIGRDLGIMADTLRAGHHVMIYPEGTSTNGETLLPFKKSLLMSAVEAEVDLLPVCIKYVEIDGEPFSPENRDKVCWHGDMDFVSHFFNVLRLKKVKVELHFLKPIPVSKESSRQDLAEKSFNAIYSTYHGQSQESGMARKSDIETNHSTKISAAEINMNGAAV